MLFDKHGSHVISMIPYGVKVYTEGNSEALTLSACLAAASIWSICCRREPWRLSLSLLCEKIQQLSVNYFSMVGIGTWNTYISWQFYKSPWLTRVKRYKWSAEVFSWETYYCPFLPFHSVDKILLFYIGATSRWKAHQNKIYILFRLNLIFNVSGSKNPPESQSESWVW